MKASLIIVAAIAAITAMIAAAAAGYSASHLRDPGVLAVCFDSIYGTIDGTTYVQSVVVTSPTEINGTVACQAGQLIDVRPQKQQPGP